MTTVVKLLLFVSFGYVRSVPPSPTSIVTDTIKSEFSTMKNTMKILSDQWEKWNTLFMTSLEPRITSTASTLASIDTNIHNLQERAHIWDTFQLHVSAWNELLASLDRKMDIISKGQEKMLTIDDKINTILNMDYKLDNTLKALNKVQDSLNNLDINVHAKKNHDSLFSEFATRGILSSMKLIEKKLDKLLLASQTAVLTKVTDDKPKPKFTMKCNIPRVLQELLEDVSSKVDIIFDNVVKIEEDGDFEGDYIDIREGSGDSINYKSQSFNKRLKKAVKIFTRPCKQTKHDLEHILKLSLKIEDITKTILEKENSHFDMLNKIKFDESFEQNISKHINTYSMKVENNINLLLNSLFSEQKVQIENVLHSKLKCCTTTSKKNIPPTTNIPFTTSVQRTELEYRYPNGDLIVDTTYSTLFKINNDLFNKTTFSSEDNTHVNILTWKPIIYQNMSSCEEMKYGNNNGVYIFENKNSGNITHSFNRRYCEFREDSFWTVVQRRDNYTFQHNFNVTWENYKYGFGNLHKDFWMGNDFLYMYSNLHNLILRIELEDFENNMVWAEYDNFFVDSESNNYKLTISGYKGNASDSFSSHSGSYFSTYDKINDAAPQCCPCSISYGGGWWFNKCFESNLNGVYFKKPYDNNYFRGLIWEHWLGNYSLKKTIMMVKLKGQFLSEKSTTENSSHMETIPFYGDP